MLVIIDNYDSFTFNLYQAFASLVGKVEVIRNDQTNLQQLSELKPDYLVISPGPGRPEQAGISIAAIRAFAGKIPILGVCLGHQAIVVAFNGNIKRASRLMHGKVSSLSHNNQGIFLDIPQNIKVMRYHSLLTDERNLPDELNVSANSFEGEIMAVQHEVYPIFGVQFHPEAYLTDYGTKMFKNFLKEGDKCLKQ